MMVIYERGDDAIRMDENVGLFVRLNDESNDINLGHCWNFGFAHEVGVRY